MDMPFERVLTVIGLTANYTPNSGTEAVFEAMASEAPE